MGIFDTITPRTGNGERTQMMELIKGFATLPTEAIQFLQNLSLGTQAGGLAGAQADATSKREASLATIRRYRSIMLTGGVLPRNLRVANIGDSKTMGAGAGTGSQFTEGAFPKSRPARMAARLRTAGWNVYEGWAGASGLASPAAKMLYDTRLTGMIGWSGGPNSLGGAMFSTGNTNPLTFTPSVAVDRISTFLLQSSTQGQLSIVKGADAAVAIQANNAVVTLQRHEAAFATKDANAFSLTRTAGGFCNVAGQVAWDSTALGIELMNFGVYGVKTAWWADTALGYSPLNALGLYKPDLTNINLGTNDLGGVGDVLLSTVIQQLSAIIAVAQLTGYVTLSWPSVGGVSPAYGSDEKRATWKAAYQALALATGCEFYDHEAMLGGRVAATAAGLFGDNVVHENVTGYDIEAAPLARLLTN